MQLDELAKGLRNVQTLKPTTAADHGAVKNISKLARQCIIPLQYFQERIKKYRPHLVQATGNRREVFARAQVAVRQVQWVVNEDEEVATTQGQY